MQAADGKPAGNSFNGEIARNPTHKPVREGFYFCFTSSTSEEPPPIVEVKTPQGV